jgi:small subunit ribosomal protein S17
MPKKQLKGKIVSDKMDKTVIVEVATEKKHRRYKSTYLSHKRYKVHDEKNEFVIGDEIIIEETKPISKDKTWRVKQSLSEPKAKAEE